MEMGDDEKMALFGADGADKYRQHALHVLHIHCVEKEEDMADDAVYYPPEFAHQHFGEKEQIFGYKNLTVKLYYSSCTMRLHPVISFDSRIDDDQAMRDVAPDDIMALLKAQLPTDDPDVLISGQDAFLKEVAEQRHFRPFGTFIHSYPNGKRQMEVYKVTESSTAFDRYLGRVQTISLWYIDAAEYTDNSDERWMHYLLYSKWKSAEGEDRRSLAGYVSVYNFYAYPEHLRPRIAQILILPPFRRDGHGARLLQTVYDDLVPQKSVIDITVEDPSDNCIHLRDYVDCINCSRLPSFSPSELRNNGFTEQMKKEAKEKLKLSDRQIRRVYEILRLKCTDAANYQQFKEYRLDVKRRLNIPFKKNQRDWQKLRKVLDEQELATVAAANLNREKRMGELEKMFEDTISDYRHTIDRLDTFAHLNGTAITQNGSSNTSVHA